MRLVYYKTRSITNLKQGFSTSVTVLQNFSRYNDFFIEKLFNTGGGRPALLKLLVFTPQASSSWVSVAGIPRSDGKSEPL